MKNAGYLATGEFAKLIGTTKETLFHYDRIGLFCPAWTDGNGYRYYSLDQVDTFDVICTLRDLGMPLAEIRAYVENRTPQSLLELFGREEEILSERIRSWKNRRDWMRKKQSFLRNVLQTDTKEIRVLYYPQQSCISCQAQGADDRVWIEASGEVLDYCAKEGLRSVYGLGYRFDSETRDYDTVYMLFDKVPSRISCGVREAGEYLTAYHVGDWRTIGTVYERMRRYAKEQGLTLERYYYEDTMLDGLTAKSTEEYVTRIICRVK